jgi:acyl carrier protein
MVGQQVSQVRGKLRQYIVENFLYMQQERPFSDDDSFLRFGIIDSLGILEIVAFVEEEWSVDVELPGITEANFGSISAIARYVAGRVVSPEASLGAA